jgi:glycosyltransferase involved in cell wall biosynthesis
VFTRRGAGQERWSEIAGVHYHRCEFALDSDFLTEINNMCNSFAWHYGEVSAALGGFDIAHGHDWLVTKALVQARNQHRAACVFTIHSTEYGRCGNHHYDGRSRMIRDLEWEGAFCSDRVIAVSGVLGREFASHYHLPPDKLTAIYNGVHAERFAEPIDVGAAKESLGIGRVDPTVLFAGRLAWQKGPDLLLEAVPAVLGRHPSAKFIIAGDGEMRGGLEERARQLGVAHAMRFLGHRRGAELADLFKVSDVVCVPSRNEPFGIVILEAWAAGKPVVVTQNGGPAEFVSHMADGIKIYDRPDSIIWGLLEGLRDFGRLRKMGLAGRRRAREQFSWHTIARRTEEVYLQALAANRRRLGLPDAPVELHILPAGQDLRARRRQRTLARQAA